MRRSPLAALFALVLTLAGAFVVTSAQAALEAPTLNPVAAGQGKVRLTYAAGESGAPDGFTIWWMPRASFDRFGSDWASVPTSARRTATFVGEATLNTWGEATQSFRLNSFESLDVELGDLADETGVYAPSEELAPSSEYVMVAFPNGGSGSPLGLLSTTTTMLTLLSGQNCTYTQGYWKTHPDAWPQGSLMLGTVVYTKTQLLQILNRPVAGNGLVSLAHQLIAAKLNLSGGASPLTISGSIAAADAMIGGLVVPPVGSGSLSTSSTSALTQALDDFNNGVTGPGHCGTTPAATRTWGALKSIYR